MRRTEQDVFEEAVIKDSRKKHVGRNTHFWLASPEPGEVFPAELCGCVFGNIKDKMVSGFTTNKKLESA